MHILITYMSNAGGTYRVAREIRDALGTSHKVVMKKANETTRKDIDFADVVLLGSMSWDFTDHGVRKEGQPHQYMLTLMRSLKNDNIILKGRKFAVFGTGDRSYTHFCGAVDVMEKWVHDVHGQLLCESLRIDEFYFHLEKNVHAAQAWTKKLKTAIKKAA